MLRIAVISLLVANLLLLGFQGSNPAVEPETIAKQTVDEDPSVPTIHLFSEMLQNQDLISGNRRCFSLGPFHSSEDKNEIQTLLEEVSASISERETLALVEKGYWVYMPPYESLLEANQALLSLQALGLKDIGVIYNGDWQNAISLGYFLRQENALRRKKDLEERDFAPMIRVQRQSESRYWLDYEQSPGSALIAIDMQGRPNDFMRRSLPCPEQDPFEIIAPVSENLAAEVKQPQTQIPEVEHPSPPVENNEPLPEETSKPQAIEINEPQLTEGNNSQPEDGGDRQPTEEIDLDPEENIGAASVDDVEVEVPEPAIENEPGTAEKLVDVTQQKQVDIPEEDGDSQPVSEDGINPELQNGTETEPETLENFVDDTLQQQVVIPEESDGSQAVDDNVIDPEKNIEATPIDSEKSEPEPAIETEVENSVGTGPVISFGTAPEEGDETETEGGDETEPDGG